MLDVRAHRDRDRDRPGIHGTGDRLDLRFAEPPQPTSRRPSRPTQSGGYGPPYHYAWDLDNDGAFDDSGDQRTVTKTFPSTGSYTVRVQITDNASPVHTTVVTKTIDVQNPPPPQPGQQPAPPPPPPPCTKEIHFQLSQFRTTGCFTETSPGSGVYTTTDAVKLNGITFPDYGQTFTIYSPSNGDGGHFTAPNSAIQLDGFTAYSGDIDWALPTGGPGDHKVVKSLTVAVGAEILGLNVRGSIALELGVDKRDPNAAPDTPDTYFASFPLKIELPGGFRAGPDTDYGRVTGAATLRTDDNGIQYAGLQLAATNVWIGKVKVETSASPTSLPAARRRRVRSRPSTAPAPPTSPARATRPRSAGTATPSSSSPARAATPGASVPSAAWPTASWPTSVRRWPPRATASRSPRACP